MALPRRQVFVYLDLQFHLQRVAEPTRSHIAYFFHAGHAGRRSPQTLCNLRVYRIHVTVPHDQRCVLDNNEYFLQLVRPSVYSVTGVEI